MHIPPVSQRTICKQASQIKFKEVCSRITQTAAMRDTQWKICGRCRCATETDLIFAHANVPRRKLQKIS